MLLKSTIAESVLEQRNNLLNIKDGLKREIAQSIVLSQDFVTVITGIRRCGKSTLMMQLMNDVGDDFAYFNFEDPRIFGFDVQDFDKLAEILGDKSYYFFDEIQNVENWELYIRKLHDRGKSICITGSNASLLSKELGTRLTGRNIQTELFPFNFSEFCAFTKRKKNTESVEVYLVQGGFPSYLKTKQIAYLQQLFKDILYRDILVRYGIRQAKTVEAIALFLIANAAKEYSLNGIKKIFSIGSANSVAEYVSWFEDSYLLCSLPRFSWSLKAIAINPKKVYTIDTGFAMANSLSFSSDKGRLFENMVYLQLRRKGHRLYYFKEKGECDFVIQRQDKIVEVIQACYHLHSDNYAREVNGLLEAMDFFKLNCGTIVTLNQQDILKFDDKTITIAAADKWLE